MNEPTQRYPLLIVPQPALSVMALSPRSEYGDTEADDRADRAGRVPYLHLLQDGDEDLLDEDDDEEMLDEDDDDEPLDEDDDD